MKILRSGEIDFAGHVFSERRCADKSPGVAFLLIFIIRQITRRHSLPFRAYAGGGGVFLPGLRVKSFHALNTSLEKPFMQKT